MSIKKYFDRAQNLQALANKSAEDIAGQVESVGYHEQDIIDEERFIPRVDFSDPANFARYGSAQEYYDQTIKRIYNEYPYDGSLRERLVWRNESNYLDLHVFDNLYPRTNGYIILSALGAATDSKEDGYGEPSTPEYILVKGGPNSHPDGSTPIINQFTGSNYYEPDKNRGSNLEFDLATKGATVEFWLNKSEFVTSDTEREVIFDLWNGQLSSSADYFRFRVELSASGPATGGENPFLVTILSGTTGIFRQPVAASTFTTASVADGNWHHYALTFASASAGIETKFYVDGNLNNSTTLGSNGINNTLHNGFRAHIGALITNISGNAYGASTMAGYGKLSGSIDEFRYWKKRRTSQEIGRFWFTQVGGGVNTDPTPFTTNQETANVDLGVYFKFNEGITGRTTTDSTVLDYSGRFSNGTWTGYNTSARSTGSAIVLSNAATSEFQDPIIYSFHPDVVTLATNLDLSGSSHDGYNNASIYKTIPSWITEQDEEGEKNVKYLTQIISSYFDTLHLQIDSLNKLKNIEYPSGSQKPLPFGERLLSGYGFVAPDIFVDADVLEVLADRSEDRVYEKSLHDIKNIIYQNIYNNLNYIYKSKGTEKAFRNLIRCFGIDDELVKINSYANNIQYEMRNNRRNVVSADRYANFNSGGNTDANVYNFTDVSNTNSVGFIPATAELFNGYATTLETEVLFPLKRESNTVSYVNTNTISASLFGIHGANSDGTETTWNVEDYVNFQVYAVRDEIDSTNVKFVLTGTTHGLVPSLESDLYQDVYNNKRWNLSVRIKPQEYPFKSLISVTSSNYVVELHGVHAEAGEILDEFTVSGTVAAPNMGFLTGSRRAYVGAHRTNFTGTLLQSSDVKVNACRFWLDSLSDQTLRGHILDTENHGTLQPDLYAFPFNTSASAGDVRKIDTLVFNWEFLNNTGSDANGRFTVADISSGSAAFTRFGALSSLLNGQYTARGDNFTPSSTTAIDKDFVMSSRLNLPENVQSEDMVRVLTAQEQDVFTNESRPVNYFFAFEKSMAQVISEEIINYFADLTTFHNLIGAPVNKYREEYKEIKLLRNRFFEKVGNTEIDFDRFYEFYKWFDSSMSIMLNQLVPASAEFSDSVRTVIESHALERSKYKNIFPFLERKGAVDLSSSVDGRNTIDGTAGASPDDFPAGTQLFSNTAFTKRQIGSSRVNQMTNWKLYHAPPAANKAAPVETENHYWHKYRKEREEAGRSAIYGAITQSYNRITDSPVKFDVEGAIALGGVGKHPAYKPNFAFNATQPYGPTVTSTNIPKNIMLSFDIDVEELIETSDVYYPTLKQRLGFGLNPSINRVDGDKLKFDGNMYAPFSLYSSSVTTGYNKEVVENYKSGTMVTNLHNDFVNSADTSLQGPFTEKFVGGRYYRHTEINDGTDTRETRAEGFRLALGLNPTGSNIPVGASGALGVIPPNYPFVDSPAGAAPLGWLPELPTAQRFRDETAKRPVNIKNILMTTASAGTRLSGTIVHNQIGNYQKNYQVVQTAGRSINDPFFQDQSFSFAPNPETIATRGRLPLTSSTENIGGDLDYELPDRSGANSNKTVFVNLFSAPGSYEVLSRGYRDPAHEELSAYNASTYRNLGVINRGQQESASLDPVEANTIAVIDHIGKNRGLNQRAALHAGPYGIDSAYGSISPDSYGYATEPSWHKTNRNRRRRIEFSGAESSGRDPAQIYITASVYDNLFVQHAIPRSTQQYSWVTASLAEGQIIYGNDRPSCFSASVLSQLIVSGTYEDASFVGLTTALVDPITASSHIVGFPLPSVNRRGKYTSIFSYINADYWESPALDNDEDYLNVLNTNRNGPYGYPTWKQIRAGETKIARKLRETNKIGTVVPPKKIAEIINGNFAGFVQPTRPNTFVDYFEPPVDSRNKPIVFSFEDNTENSNPENNIIVSVPYGNDIEYFNNNGLNNRLGLTVDMDRRRSYHSVRDFALESNLSVVVNYGERIYPSAENAYKPSIRSRQNFVIDRIWDNNRTDRSLKYGLSHTSSTGFNVSGASTWPLDAHLDFSLLQSLTASDGAGELMSLGARFTSGAWGTPYLAVFGYNPDPNLRNDNTQPSFPRYTETTASACYAMRVYAGYTASNGTLRQPRPVFAGDVPWVAPEQAGKVPYKPYTDFSDKLSRLGKDYSLVPEFRISTLMGTYLNDKSGDFTDDVDILFNLTGASLADSSDEDFYTVYSNGDFLKYFKFIDDDLYDKRSGDLKIVRDKIELSCDALLKFLPYKGFYPAERTLELSTLFSQSFADATLTLADYYEQLAVAGQSAFDPAAFRIALEPLYAPGIMFNTIKSGISVSNYVITAVSGQLLQHPVPNQAAGALGSTTMHFYQSSATSLPEGNILYGMGTGSSGYLPGTASAGSPPFLPVSSSCPILAVASGSRETAGKMIKKVPFEALQRPAEFFNLQSISTNNDTVSTGLYIFLYDTAPSGSHHWSNSWVQIGSSYNSMQSGLMFTSDQNVEDFVGRNGDFKGGKLYELAIDNFLCETTNFFMLGPSNFQSAREENFKTVISGTTYQMKLNLYRSSNTASNVPDNKKFEMYSRASAFGAPLVADDVSTKTKVGSTNNFNISDISFSHVTPPYYAGSGSAVFTYTARYDGKPSLDEILSEATIDFSRKELVINENAENAKVANRDRPSERGEGLNEDFRVQLDSSFNLLEKIQEVPSGSTELKNRWLIQSKFETPILNFANVSTGSQFLPANDTKGGASQARDVITRGMWHQYGSLLTGSDVGVFAIISDVGENSLADVVGFEKGVVKRVGAVRPDRVVKEAVVAVPFKTIDGERRFIDLPLGNPQIDYTRSNTYKKMAQALDTYVFPPKFDFKRFESVNPVLMYIFEFSVKFSQKDLADMWQNLPPDLEDRFERQNAVVEERELIDLITSKNEDIEWMVFKVKQRAKKDYDRFRRSLVTNDVSNLPVKVRSPLTYNWPYDYFSIVELARIEESAQYVSTDIKKLAPVSDLERLEVERTPIPGTGTSERQRRQNQSRSPRSRTPQIELAPVTETTRTPPSTTIRPVPTATPRTEQATLPKPASRKKGRGVPKKRKTSIKPIKKNKKGR